MWFGKIDFKSERRAVSQEAFGEFMCAFSYKKKGSILEPRQRNWFRLEFVKKFASASSRLKDIK